MRRRDDAEFHEPTHTDFEVTTLGDERSRLGDEMLMPVTAPGSRKFDWLWSVSLLCPANARLRPSLPKLRGPGVGISLRDSEIEFQAPLRGPCR